MALNDLLRPRINELGKIKIGGLGEQKTSRSGGSYRAPTKHDYFTVTTLLRTPDGDLAPDTKLMDSLSAYADQDGRLRQLPVVVVSNEIEDVMQSSWVWYQGKRVAGRSDGKRLTVFFDLRANQWLDKPKEMDWDEQWSQIQVNGVRLFKLHTTVNVMISAQEARFGGIYKFRTTSQITAEQIYGSLVHMRQLTGGFLRGLPMRMVVRPMKVSPQGKTTTVYVVHLELVGSDLMAIQTMAMDRAKYELANAKALQQSQIEYRRLLALPGYESDEEVADHAQEFHPEHEAAEPPAAPAPAPDPLASQLGLQDQPALGDTGDPEADPFANESEGSMTDMLMSGDPIEALR